MMKVDKTRTGYGADAKPTKSNIERVYQAHYAVTGTPPEDGGAAGLARGVDASADASFLKIWGKQPNL